MKVFLIILGVIAGIIALICCILSLKVWITVDYEDKFFLKIRWAFLKFDILPSGEKKPKKQKPKEEKPEEPPKEEKPAEKKKKQNPLKVFLQNEGLEGLYNILYQTCSSLGGFFGKILRKIKIEKLFFSLTVAGGDAADTAIQYGKVSSVVFPMLGYICSHMRVGQYDADIHPDFLAQQSHGELHSLISFRPIVLTNGAVVLVFQLIFKVLIRFLRGIKTPKGQNAAPGGSAPGEPAQHPDITMNHNEGGASE